MLNECLQEIDLEKKRIEDESYRKIYREPG